MFRVISPDDEPTGRTAAEIPRSPMPPDPIAQLAARLANELAARLLPPVASPSSVAPADTRTPSPGVISSALWSLRNCLDSDERRNATRRRSWGGYRTLVRHWEAAWGGPGPDLRTITAQQLFEGFSRVAEWHSRRAWQKNRDYWFALAKSCCRQTRRNRYGIPKTEIAPLNEDDLPIWDLPPDAWFASRPRATTAHAGHRRSTLELLSQADFDRLMLSAEQSPDPLWLKTLLGWEWFCGMRIRQTLHELRFRADANDEGIDLDNRLLHSHESKCGGVLDLPLPDWLCSGLRALRDRGRSPFVFWVPTHWKNLGRWFYSCRKPQRVGWWDACWLRAGFSELQIRKPHQMRGTAISYWLAGDDEKYRKLITGHSFGDDIQLSKYAAFGPDFRRAVEAHPRPSISLV